MATYVNDLRLKEIATGDEAGTWGTSTNTNLELIAEAFSFGTEAITTNADTHTTTIADGSTDPGRSIYLQYTGALDSDCTVTIGPNTVSKLWFIENATTDSGSSGPYNIIIKQGSGATVTVPNGNVKAIYSDGAGSGGKMVDAFTNLHVNGLTSEVTGNDAALTVISTDSDASAGPLIVFQRESSSPADDDLIGRVNFNARNDASEDILYAQIRSTIKDASDGTEDADLIIATVVDGSTRSRAKFSPTETVFNDASVDLDFRVETDTDANALFIQGSSNRVTLGFNANIAVGGINPHLSVVGTDNGGSGIGAVRYSADTGGSRFVFGKSRNGSIATGGGTVVQSGDTIGLVQFVADDGSDVASRAARIQSAVDGTPGSNDTPGRLEFHTTSDGAATETERMRITEEGDLLINTTTDYGGKVNIATADNNTQLTLVSTDADANVGPRFDLLRDSSSPAANDNLGQMRFLGDDSGGNETSYAFFNCLIGDPTDGAEDGILRIETRVGGANKERVTMDSTETVINDNSADLDFRIETDGAANKFFVDGGNNVVVIGNNAPVSSVSVDSTFEIQGNSNANSGMSINRYTNNNSGPYINFSKSRSTSVGDNFTIVQDGDTLGRVSFVAADGTNFAHQAAKIVGALDGTPGENDVPGRLEFHTTADGASSTSEAMRIDDSQRVGIGQSSPATKLDVNGGLHGDHATFTSVAGRGLKISTESRSGQNDGIGVIDAQDSEGDKGIISLKSAGTETARVTTSQILIGQTSGSASDVGVIFQKTGNIFATADGGASGLFRRLTSNGEVIRISKDSTTVGNIGVRATNNLFVVFRVESNGDGCGLSGSTASTGAIIPTDGDGDAVDNHIDLGASATRFDDVFSTGGINTSDRNEKQDIEDLSDAEKRVAVACKALIKKFRWKSSVAEKGDDARIHVGIIAQDLQAAFEAEGLDAERYGMWCSDTWTDEETGEEVTRQSVRYNELLAFIISAI